MGRKNGKKSKEGKDLCATTNTKKDTRKVKEIRKVGLAQRRHLKNWAGPASSSKKKKRELRKEDKMPAPKNKF